LVGPDRYDKQCDEGQRKGDKAEISRFCGMHNDPLYLQR